MKLTKEDLKGLISEEIENTLNEDAMDINVLKGFAQIVDNFAIVSYPALAAMLGMTAIEIKQKIQSYLHPEEEKISTGNIRDPEYRAE